MAADVFTFDAVALARLPLAPTGPASEHPAGGLLAEGVFLASRSLDRADPLAPRANVARTAYALRARTRTTPHGVWCAVAAAVIGGQETVLRLTGGHRTVTVPSPLWLHALADRHLETPATLDSLTLTANNLAVHRGPGIEAEHPGPAGTGQLGSVTATDLSLWLLTRCADPAPASKVIADIQTRYPGATTAAARTALAQMIRTGLLLTDLLPQDLRADPLRHLTQHIAPTHRDHAMLSRLRSLLVEAGHHGVGAKSRLDLLHRARDAADQLHHVDSPFTVDTLAGAELRLPADVGRRAAQAASVLWRIGQRGEPLRAWTGRFINAYGPHRTVPLLEAVDPAAGIGPPGPEDAIAATADLDDRRSRYLFSLLTDALVQGRTRIVLTPEDVQHLEHQDGLPPRTAEIHLRVADRAGKPPLLTVGPHASQDAGSAAARFARWLPQLLGSSEDASPTGAPVLAEIVCRPLTARTAALAPETGACPFRIPVGVPMRPGDLRPADLAVASTSSHLVLWSHQLNRPVTPVLLSRITRDLLPPAAQFLHLLGHAGERPWHPWSWGPAASSPYTPRVTYRDVVFAPQRWTLPDDLVTAAAHRMSWPAQLDRWLSRTRPVLPGSVVAEESDRLLLLDLTDADQREIMRRTVAAGTRTVTEPIGYDYDELPVHGPDGRHPLELVVSLRRRTNPPPPVLDPRTAPRPRRDDTARGWLSAALAVPVRHQDEVLRQLPPAPGARLFYWLRYRTPALGPHLRLRFHADPATPDTLSGIERALTAWAECLAEQRLSDGLLHIEPYVRETQRYGGTDAIDHAEAFFAADSAFAQAALHLSDSERHVLAAHSAAAIAAASPPAARGGPLTPDERQRRDELRPLTRARPTPAAPDTLAQDRQQALSALLPHLTGPGGHRTVSDLIHLHCNRLLGTDAGAERIVRSLAVDLLHRHG